VLTTKKVLEDAIKVREDKVAALEKQMDDDLEGLDHVFSEPAIKKLHSQIAELKQSLQIIYDANNNK
jgi:predicted  nucleic acid-binding Zn-ribbon protein